MSRARKVTGGKGEKLQFLDGSVGKEAGGGIDLGNLEIAVTDTERIFVTGTDLKIGVSHDLAQVDAKRSKSQISPVVDFE